MNLKQLTAIHAIVESGSVRAAAKLLGVTQPAISKIVSRTEAQLGFALFERSAGTLRPNLLAVLIHDRASQLLAMSAQIEQEVAGFARGEAGQLRIGYGPATRVQPVPALIRAIRREFPKLHLRLKQVAGAALAAGVQNGEFDFAISFSGNASSFGDLKRIRLFENEIVMVAALDHPVHAKKVTAPRDFLAFPVASVGVVDAMRAVFGRMNRSQEANLHAFVCDNNELVIEQVLSGAFLGSGARYLFEGPIQAGQLKIIEFEWPWRYDCWLIATESALTLPLVRAVCELARGLAFPEPDDALGYAGEAPLAAAARASLVAS